MQFLTEITNLLLFLVKISILRIKIVKYECILACNSSHFNNFTGNNCPNYTHKCSFSWALIWYKILCDIIYTLSCRGGHNHFATLCRYLFWIWSHRKSIWTIFSYLSITNIFIESWTNCFWEMIRNFILLQDNLVGNFFLLLKRIQTISSMSR